MKFYGLCSVAESNVDIDAAINRMYQFDRVDTYIRFVKMYRLDSIKITHHTG